MNSLRQELQDTKKLSALLKVSRTVISWLQNERIECVNVEPG